MPFAAPVQQHVPAAGRQPDAEILLIGGIVTASAHDAAAVLALIENSDVARPATAAVLEAARVTLATSPEVYGAAAVLDMVVRSGSRAEIRRVLADAVASGAGNHAAALREYAAWVVAGELRRMAERFGNLLIESAADAEEGVLVERAQQSLSAIHATSARLAILRGEEVR